VSDNPVQTTTPDRKAEVGRILLEAVLVTLAGAAFAFAANGLSPRGLALMRDYFPAAIVTSPPAGNSTNPITAAVVTRTNPPSAQELLAARLKERGLQMVDAVQAEQLFRDPRYAQELIVFVDARDDQHYQEGHIPGARQFDRYHPERYFAAVMPACQAAQQIVVYCIGGDCDDSEFAAVALRDTGVAKEKLFVYAGGITEWATNGLPIEVGSRKSGKLRDANK
jgi:rhodanese-related sulfurtransferase